MKERILHVSCGGLGHGGVSAVIFSIVETLHEQFDFDCVVFKKKCEKENQFVQYGRLFRINAYNDDGKRHLGELLFRPWRMFWGVYKICKTEKYKAIHCHNNSDEGFCLLAAKCAGVPIRIAHSHNTQSPKKRNGIIKVYEYLNRRLMMYAATDFVGCSEAACESFFGSVDSKVIFNAVELNKFHTAKRIPHECLTFIHVGRYTFQKNQQMVISIFQRINHVIPNSKLLLVGFGEDKEKLENQIHNLKIDDKVQLIPGNQVDVSKMYAIADYMIFPSVYEGFGIVLIEAQAMRLPCFVSEAVQREADAGLLTYISLDSGVEVWANTILNYIKENKVIDVERLNKNLYKYSNESIGKQYAMIYRGQRND